MPPDLRRTLRIPPLPIAASEDRVWSKGGEDVTVRLSRFLFLFFPFPSLSIHSFCILPRFLVSSPFTFFSSFLCSHSRASTRLCLCRLSRFFSSFLLFACPGLEPPTLRCDNVDRVALRQVSTHSSHYIASAREHLLCSHVVLSSLRQRRSCGSSPDTHTVRSRSLRSLALQRD